MTSNRRRVGCSGGARRGARRALSCALAIAAIVTATDAGAHDSAVILTYQRFAAETGRLATTLDELDAHLAHLQSGGYAVLPLGRLAAALAQQSGAAHRGSNPYALPRFSVFGRFAAAARFRVVAGALPLEVQELVPSEPVVEANPPDIGFTLPEGLEGAERLSCYASGLGMVPLIRLGARRIELSLAAPLPAGRNRVNCTLPGPEGRWRWLGLQLLVPEPE